MTGLSEKSQTREHRLDTANGRFGAALNEVKYLEYDAYQQVISSWERENLLLNV